MKVSLPQPERFTSRHIGPRPQDIEEMVQTLGYDSLDSFIDAVVPDDIRLRRPLALPKGKSEREVLRALRSLAGQNQIFRSYLGMGYYGTFTPRSSSAISWRIPAGTPRTHRIRPEISQGRLEALLNFQTMVADLTGLEIANASLLDEGTAAAEAMMADRVGGGEESAAPVFLVDPRTVTRRRSPWCRPAAEPLGNRSPSASARLTEFDLRTEVFGVLVQYPGDRRPGGRLRELCQQAHEAGALW